MKLKYVLPCFAIIFSLFSTVGFAWNAAGHKVIAQIAYDNLTPEVRAKVNSLVCDMNHEYPKINSFLDLVVWPDQLRSQKIETYVHWHYIDVAFSKDGTPLKNLVDTDNALWAVNKISLIVKNKSANPYERARFLAFYAHIVGDLHQPLHTVSCITSELPNGDKGGNAYHVIYRNKKSNLHSMWDGGVGAFVMSQASSSIETLAQRLMSLYPESFFNGKADDLITDDWVKEGMINATQYAYTISQNAVVSDKYIQEGKLVAEQQAVLAGYRLAKSLNLLLS